MRNRQPILFIQDASDLRLSDLLHGDPLYFMSDGPDTEVHVVRLGEFLHDYMEKRISERDR